MSEGRLGPLYVSPTVVLLCHEGSTSTAAYSRSAAAECTNPLEQTEGVFFKDDFSADEFGARWHEATSFAQSRHASSIAEAKLGIKERLGRDVMLSAQYRTG